MTTTLILLLAAALGYSFLRMRAGADWARPATVAFALPILLLTVVRGSCTSTAPRTVDLAAASAFEQTTARRLAEALGRQMRRGSRAVVFALTADPNTHDAMVAGLEKGFEPYGIILAAVLPPIPRAEHDPQRQLEDYEAALAEHPNVGGVVIYGNPAADMERMPSAPTGIPVAIMAQRLTAREALRRVKRGTAAVVVVLRPGVDWPAVARIQNPAKRSNETYLLITPQNAAATERSLD